MAKDTEFCALVREMLAPLGTVTTRAMFGGFNVALGGLTFGLVADDRLYLKVDDRTRGRYEALGLSAFQPFPDKPGTMNYYPVPDDLMDEPDSLCDWAREAFDVALKAKKKK